MFKLAIVLVMAACAHRRGPLDAPMPRPIAIAPPPCELPPVPDPPMIIGYATAGTIYVTVDDLQVMTRQLAEVTAWLRSAERCFDQMSVQSQTR